ncbi:Probable peroxidase 61 [Ancistrocladus abbreviatus]
MVRGSICVDVSSVIVVMVVVTLTLDWCMVVDGANILPPDGLTRHYYKKHNTCDDVEAYIQHEVQLFWKRDKSITPKLLRLLYSDCFVTGCDGSILLDGPDSEKTAPQNAGLGGFVVIDKIKEVLEKRCPGVVSCADILNLATRDAVHLVCSLSFPFSVFWFVRTTSKDNVNSLFTRR